MFRTVPFAILACIAACNTSPESSKAGSPSKSYRWTVDEEREFLSGCVDSAKVKIGEAAAFAQCKCILNQLKQTYPGMDSAAPALMDAKKVAALLEKCK